MMKFKWTVNKVLDYLCVKQPCFYIVPQYHHVLQLLENLLKMKFKEDVSEEWNLARIKTKEEMIITNTYLNTRILPEEEKKEIEEEEKESITFREQIESSMPRNNRNIENKSSTYNNELKNANPHARIRFEEEGKVGYFNFLVNFILIIYSLKNFD